MTFKKRRIILFLIVFAYILSLIFFRDFLFDSSLGTAILILFLVAYFILHLALWRCDSCGRYLGKLSIFATHCPFCGRELE